MTRGQEDTGPDGNLTAQKWVSSSNIAAASSKMQRSLWQMGDICDETAVDRIIFQSTASLPPSVRARAKRSGGELTDSDQLSQVREAGGDLRQKQKVVTAEQLSCTPVAVCHW